MFYIYHTNLKTLANMERAMKKSISLIILVLLTVTVLVTTTGKAEAQVVSNVVTNVVRIAQTDTVTVVRLKEVNGAFEKNVNITNNFRNQQLAILLSAMSLNKPVRVFFNDQVGQNPATLISVAIENF